MARSFYEILEIKRDASQEDVKQAFRTLAKKHHPDKGGDEAKFKEVSQAYSTLSDPAKRRNYDLTLPSAGIRRGTGDPFGFASATPPGFWEPPVRTYRAADFHEDVGMKQAFFNRAMDDIMRQHAKSSSKGFWEQAATDMAPPKSKTAQEAMREEIEKRQKEHSRPIYTRAGGSVAEEIYWDPQAKSYRSRPVKSV